MDCEFAEKVSMLVDGELPATEIEAVRTHIAGCPECRNLEKDFLFFRQQVKESFPERGKIEQAQPWSFPDRKRARLWGRWGALPAPAAAVLVLALIGLSVWLAASRFNRVSNDTAMRNRSENIPAKIESPPKQNSLARFDKGGRTEIYVVPLNKE